MEEREEQACECTMAAMSLKCDLWHVLTAVIFLSIFSFAGVASDCPTEEDAERCMSEIGMDLNDIRYRRLFGSNNSSDIEPICSSANIPGAMECMKIAIRFCSNGDPHPQLKLIDLEGFHKAMMFTCKHLKVYRDKVEPCTVDPDSIRERRRCGLKQFELAKSHLMHHRAMSDPRARLCTDHRMNEFCTDVAYRKVCGNAAADYIRHIAFLTKPGSCDCATDRGYCPPPLPPYRLASDKTPTKPPKIEDTEGKTVQGSSSEAKVDGIRIFIIILFLLLSLL